MGRRVVVEPYRVGEPEYIAKCREWDENEEMAAAEAELRVKIYHETVHRGLERWRAPRTPRTPGRSRSHSPAGHLLPVEGLDEAMEEILKDLYNSSRGSASAISAVSGVRLS